MKKGIPQIVLFQPEIPQNAGTIGRLVAAVNSRLHLIKPLGFATDDKNLKRAGLDYWPFLDLEIHDDAIKLFNANFPKIAFLAKRAKKNYTEIPKDTELIIFGRETSGLNPDFWTQYPECFYSIPHLNHNVRSLNLANSVSIVLFDQLRQRGFNSGVFQQ